MTISAPFSGLTNPNRLSAAAISGITSGTVSSVDPIVHRVITNIFGPGHSTGGSLLTSTGATVNFSNTYVNNSGREVTVADLVFVGWRMATSTTGPVDNGNDLPLTANIEYPIGGTTTDMLQSGSTSLVVPNGGILTTDSVTLATPIPAGASFKVNMSSTQTAGQFYLGQASFTGGTTAGFGLCGVCTTALRSTMRKEALFGIGDSIHTNNDPVTNAIAVYLGCPSIHISISGTQANTYAASSGAKFVKMAELAGALGITRFVSNFGTNDFGTNGIGTGRTAAELQTDLQTLRSLAAAQGVLFTQCTLLPRTSRETVTTTAQSCSGNVITLTVPDGSKFVVGGTYTIAGAGDAQYNGEKFCDAISGNDLSFVAETGTPASTTGTVTITSRFWSTRGLQVPFPYHFDAGTSSQRGIFNAYVRAGNFDSYIDWGDACELVRNDGVFAVYGDKPELDPTQLTTVKTTVSTTRFKINGTWVNPSMVSGSIQMTSGPNIGVRKPISSQSAADDITVSTAYGTSPAPGDACWVASGSYTSDDGTHPRTATGTKGTSNYRGGQALLFNKSVTWLEGLLA